MNETSTPDTAGLFTQALNVVNGALTSHENTPPYKQIIDAAKTVLDDRKMGVAVYENDPKSPFDYYTVRCKDGVFELVSHGKDAPAIDWKVSRDYLHKLVDNQKEYIENPAKIDWDWLKDRLNLAA